ncbi:MAG TPA: DUF4162 domain-containing protein, partial [Natronoarchaeum rubrum]|nr:DUF4162 domain-containing protein [Natronoarchaeum rubrum]
GGGTKLLIDVDELNDATTAAVRGVDGVETVTVRDGSTLEVTCTNDAKMDVMVELQGLGADVVNFRTEEASLEDMFVAYTGGGRE